MSFLLVRGKIIIARAGLDVWRGQAEYAVLSTE
jgi:hypothetical protein